MIIIATISRNQIQASFNLFYTFLRLFPGFSVFFRSLMVISAFSHFFSISTFYHLNSVAFFTATHHAGPYQGEVPRDHPCPRASPLPSSSPPIPKFLATKILCRAVLINRQLKPKLLVYHRSTVLWRSLVPPPPLQLFRFNISAATPILVFLRFVVTLKLGLGWFWGTQHYRYLYGF